MFVYLYACIDCIIMYITLKIIFRTIRSLVLLSNTSCKFIFILFCFKINIIKNKSRYIIKLKGNLYIAIVVACSLVIFNIFVYGFSSSIPSNVKITFGSNDIIIVLIKDCLKIK